MTFESLFNNCSCDCLHNSFDPTSESTFLRKLNKDEVLEKDFLTHWERGKEPENDNCEEVCGYRGLSIDLTSDIDEESILERYRTTFKINPKKGSFCLKFRFVNGNGKVKHTPYINADTHHDFYKADGFTFDQIEKVDILKYA